MTVAISLSHSMWFFLLTDDSSHVVNIGVVISSNFYSNWVFRPFFTQILHLIVYLKVVKFKWMVKCSEYQFVYVLIRNCAVSIRTVFGFNFQIEIFLLLIDAIIHYGSIRPPTLQYSSQWLWLSICLLSPN